MAELTGDVRQVNPLVLSDNDEASVRLNREYALQINTREGLVDKWTREGRVFIAQNPVTGQPETMSATGTAITLTAPSLRYTIPEGNVVAPISVQVNGFVANAKKALFCVLVSDTDTYTSGGDAVLMVPRNALIQSNAALRGSSISKLHYCDTAIVEAAVTRTRTLKFVRKMGTATDETTWNPEYNILKGDPMVYIVGPASFLVYVVSETAALEAEWTMSWAELSGAVVP